MNSVDKFAKETVIATMKKLRENPDGTEDWIAKTPFTTINYDFIKCFEKHPKVKGLSFDAVSSIDGQIVLYFTRKPKNHADKKTKERN